MPELRRLDPLPDTRPVPLRPPSSDARRPLPGAIAVFLILAALLAAMPEEVWSSERLEPVVCLAKTDETGGKLGFAVLRGDAQRFLRAGFTRETCPESLDRAEAGIGARCERLRALDSEGRKLVATLYGLSVESMCDAHDTWAWSRDRSP